jgi:hypothetical protein
MSIVASHGGPNTPKGYVEGPRSAWLAPGIRKRTPEAIAQNHPFALCTSGRRNTTRSNARGSPKLS